MPSKPRIHCPNCDSSNVRAARPRNLNEFVGEFLGRFVFRCHRCGERFSESVFGLETFLYSKCPKCFRMDLTTWSESHYRPTFWMRFRLWFGARRVRCEACRCNFVSFRKRRETYQRPEQASVRSVQTHQPASPAARATKTRD